MPIERKSYPVTELKIADDQLGVIEAIVSVFNNVDHGNEKVLPGFFAKSIEKKLPKGVWAHDWKQPIAKTLEAKELLPGDPSLPAHLKELGGTYIKGQFNLETQRGREAYSDIKFGIVDEFSIGYAVIKDGKDKETGARELIEGDWKEWSPVLVGMNDQTSLISIKTEDDTFTEEVLAQVGKGMLAEQLAQTTPSTWEIESAFRRVICKIAESAKNAPSIGESSFDWRAKVAEVVSEYGPTMQPLIIAQIEEFLNSTDDEFYLKGESVSGSFESFDDVVSALEKQTHNMQRNHEARVKEGRILSTSNRAKVLAARDALDELLAASEPLPKEKEIDMEALRTQSQRRYSHALAALAPHD
jgi:HK97 family phage prohead protease